MRALRMANIMHDVFDLDQVSFASDLLDDGSSCRIAVHALEFAAEFIHRAVRIHADRLRKIVAFRNCEVIRIMGRRALHDGGAEVHVDIIIADDRQFLSVCRVDRMLSDQMLVALVVRVHDDAHIAEHRLRTGGRNMEFLAGLNDLVAHVVHLAGIILIVDLDVAEGSAGFRIPVDDPPAAVDQAFVVQGHEHMADCFVETFIHRETLTAVVQAVAQLRPLLADGGRIFFFPFPSSFQELLPADVVAGNAFGLQAFIYFCLGCDAGMIHARQIQHVIALHALVAGNDVLERVVPGMADMQDAGHIGRRDHDRERVFRLVTGGEVSFLHPVIIPSFLHCLVVVLRCEILFHTKSSEHK